MAIELDNSFTVPVPPAEAWEILLDVERIAPCMPGASVLSISDDGNQIEGQVKVKLGPLALTYKGTAKFTDKDQANHAIAIEAAGKETRGAGTASANVQAALKPGDTAGSTLVSIHTSLNVTGRPAQFGRSLLPEVSGKLIAQFASNLEALIAADGATAESATAPEPAAATGPFQNLARFAAAVTGPEVLRPAFPEPVVIGPVPRLRSDPIGLPDDWHKVPDIVLDGADVGNLAIRGASLRGDGHRYTGDTRQDSMDIFRVRAGVAEAILGCVADGASNARLSHFGAAETCRLVRDEVRHRLPKLFEAAPGSDLHAICQDLAESVAERLRRRAGFLKVPPGALSTTLAAAVVESGEGRPSARRWAAFAIGDAAAFVLRESAFLPCFAGQQDAGIASTATFALPASIGQVATAAGRLEPGDVLVLCTDGLADPLRNADLSGQLRAWWGTGNIPSLPEFGWQMSFRIRTYDDDRTAICFWAR